jgi:leucine dehydrogenase
VLAYGFAWDGELTAVRYDRETGAWLLVGIHSTALGPAAGGTRAMEYESLDEAVTDVTKLASAMTMKMAVADLPMGGGKSVIALPRARSDIPPEMWSRLLRFHAENLNTLAGAYWTGPDVNTNSADMDSLGETTKFVFGRSTEKGGSGSSADNTAVGVYHSLLATAEAAGLGSSLQGLSVLVQGLGAVGDHLAELAQADGAVLTVADVDSSRVARWESKGAQVVSTDAVTSTACDVFAPCATGGVIDESIATRIPCAAIAGAANNPLTSPLVADVLAERGIVYAPDFVSNGGGAIHLVGYEVLGWPTETVDERIRGIGETLRVVFTDARERGISTEQAARDLAQRRIEGAAPARS